MIYEYKRMDTGTHLYMNISCISCNTSLNNAYMHINTFTHIGV